MPNSVTEPCPPRRQNRSRSQTRRRRRRAIYQWLAVADLLSVVIILFFLAYQLPHGKEGSGPQSPQPPQESAVSQQYNEAAPPISPEQTAVSLAPTPGSENQTALADTPETEAQFPPVDAMPSAAEPEPLPEVITSTTGSVVPDNISEIALPEGEAKDSSWLSDAVLIGDSRMDGFRLYSGASEADYIVRAGMTVWEVTGEKRNISVGGTKYSAYEVLSWKQYAKVYLSIGINELGYYNPSGYAETYGKIIDKARQLQPNAQIYVMTLIPVNTQACRENGQRDYVNNELIRQYNDALVRMAVEKGVFVLNPVEIFADENGELIKSKTGDGVHFVKDGYTAWKDYLLCHTGE